MTRSRLWSHISSGSWRAARGSTAITRHVLGLFHAVPGARAFRRHLATAAVKPDAGAAVLLEALGMILDTRSELAHIAAA